MQSLLYKRAAVNFRCSESDKAGMVALAKASELSVSELLLRLFYFADGLMREKARSGGVRS